ncbi:hypothetical protein BJY52DRAFT_1285837 [Lactarius psammicola]|nr:hypothetical protein BJY52DRAFT_1285837 [Lactarius psammicola]
MWTTHMLLMFFGTVTARRPSRTLLYFSSTALGAFRRVVNRSRVITPAASRRSFTHRSTRRSHTDHDGSCEWCWRLQNAPDSACIFRHDVGRIEVLQHTTIILILTLPSHES